MDGETLEENASGDGQYDAFLMQLQDLQKRKYNSPNSLTTQYIYHQVVIPMPYVRQASLG